MDLQSVAIDAARQNGIPPDFFLSLIGNGEGGFSNPGLSPKGALGPAQLMPGTAADMGVSDRADPVQSINGGAKYASQLWKKYGGDPVLTAAAYNAGPGAVDHHGGVPPFPETQQYVQRVTAGMGEAQDKLPPPDQVLGGYGQGAGSASGGQGAAKDTGSEAGMPTPEQIMADYAPAGSGQVVYPTGRPVLAAQEKAILARKQAGQLDLTKPQGSDLNPFVEQPGIPVPVGAAKVDVNGNFAPASAQPAQATPQDTSLGGIYAARVNPAIGALAHDFTAPLEQYRSNVPARGPIEQAALAGEKFLAPVDDALSRPGQAIAHGISYLSAPVMAGFDYLFGKPVNALSGGRIPIQTGGDIASIVAPGVGELNEARALDAAAARAGLSPQAYRTMAATTDRTAQTLAAAKAAAPKPPGPVGNALAPFAARFSQAAAEQQAGQKIAGAASDLPAAKAALANGPDEIVPGSTPTTFQQTGDVGLGSLERSVATKNPELFAARRGDQNTARVGVLQALQSGADPAQLSASLRDGLYALDAQTDQAAQAAARDAQARAATIGGAGTPEVYGADIRGAVTAAQDTSKAAYKALYDAVDPNGDLTANVVQTKAAAKDIPASQPATAAPITGEEAGIYQAAAQMPDIAPARDLMALKVRVNDAAGQALREGDSAGYARLSKLRSALQDNLANTIANKVAVDDAAVKAGTMAPEQAAGVKLAAQVQKFYQDRAAGRAVSGDLGTGGGPGLGAPRAVGVAGTGEQARGQPGPAPGNPGLPNAPSFDDAARQRQLAADTAYAQHDQTFGIRPVTDITRTNGYKGQFTLPNGEVPGKFFHPGPAAYQHMQALLKAAGPEAMPVIEDFAANSLKRAALKDDGTLDPGKYASWVSRHQDALRALPAETQARFADAAKAAEAVNEALASRTAALKAYQQGAIGRVLNASEPEDVTRIVGQILNGKTSVQDMKALARVTQGNADARAGLRQAIADHITGKLIGNTEAGTSGQGAIKADAFQNFSRQSRAALLQVFAREEVDRIEAIARDIQRAKRSENAIRLPGNSNTAQDQNLIAKHGGKGVQGFIDILGAMIGGSIGHTHGAPSLVGEALGGATAHYLQSLRSAGVQRVEDVITRAMLDPNVARELLAKVPVKNGKVSEPILNARMRGLYAALVGIGGVATPAQPAPQRNALAQ